MERCIDLGAGGEVQVGDEGGIEGFKSRGQNDCPHRQFGFLILVIIVYCIEHTGIAAFCAILVFEPQAVLFVDNRNIRCSADNLKMDSLPVAKEIIVLIGDLDRTGL